MDSPHDEVERSGDDLGRQYQASLDRGHRHRSGVFYTPRSLASGLTRAAFEGLAERAPARVCDPSCGGGAFVVAVADALEDRLGLSRTEIASEFLWGADVDPDAVDVAREEIARWVGDRDVTADDRFRERLAAHVVVGDTLAAGSTVWGDLAPAFDLVIGNPPFQSQLGRSTTRAIDYTASVRTRLGIAAAAYTDTAALFLLSGLDLVRPGGRVLLIQPQSVLSTRDTAPVRAEVAARGTLVGMWADDGQHFDASVQVCAPIIDRAGPGFGDSTGATALGVRRWTGPGVDVAAPFEGPLGSLASTWAPLLAEARGVPVVQLGATDHTEAGAAGAPTGLDTIGERASVSAGFRQHFYGLIPFVEQSDESDQSTQRAGGMRLITSGLVDPAHERWERATTRFGGRTFLRPVVDTIALAAADPDVAAWGASLATPKLVVATQTRVVEVIADRDGSRWPSVPTIAVCASADELSRLAAVLLAPAVSAWALTHFAGAALSADAVKLSAAQIRTIPLPRHDHGAWDDASQAFEAAERCAEQGDGEGWSVHLDELGQLMGRAYGVGDEVFAWWRARRPPFRA